MSSYRLCQNCSVELGNSGATKRFGFYAQVKERKVKIVRALNEVFYRRTNSLAPTEEDKLEYHRALCYLCAKALGNLHHHFNEFKNRSLEGSYCMEHYINAILNATSKMKEPEMVDVEVQTKWTWTQKKLIAAVAKPSGVKAATAKEPRNIAPLIHTPGQWLLVYGNEQALNSGAEKRKWDLKKKKRCVVDSYSTSRLKKSQSNQVEMSNASFAHSGEINIESNTVSSDNPTAHGCYEANKEETETILGLESDANGDQGIELNINFLISYTVPPMYYHYRSLLIWLENINNRLITLTLKAQGNT